jgi:hypothetical protein
MLTLISSIPTTVREGFDAQDLPPRASTVSEDTLENIFGGDCRPLRSWCLFDNQCCSYNCRFFNCA